MNIWEEVNDKAKELYVKDSGILEDWELVDESVRISYRLLAVKMLDSEREE